VTRRSDILGVDEIYRSDGAIKDRGLIYTTECGWVDLGHANPHGKGFEGASALWDQIRARTDYLSCARETTPAVIIYKQSMRKFGMEAGVTRRYHVLRDLSSNQEQKSIALAIFLDVSLAFEGLQSNWFFRHVTDSGYSVEDLLSNLIGFYRAVNPGIDYIKICRPVSKERALATWDAFGAVGNTKNIEARPVFYPDPLSECGFPRKGALPPQLNTIKPSVIGENFREIR